MTPELYETWAQEHKLRQVSVHPGELPNTITLCFSSSADTSVMKPADCVRSFGLVESQRLFQQRGREKWHHNLTKEAAKQKIAGWRMRATKDGFAKLERP